LISSFQRDHPRVRIKVLSSSSIEIQRGLDIFDLDAGVSYLDNEPLLRVGTLPLYSERYFLVTGDRRVFRGRKSVTWAEAADLPLCLLTPDMQNRRIVDAIFQKAQHVPAPLVETNSLLALYAQVRSRGMATILTQASLYVLGMPRWLRAFPLVAPAARRTIGLVYPDRKPQQPVARAFVDSVRQLDIDGEMLRNIPPALRQQR
jgi:DNA-binding transcriptional LysR family regulator